MDQCELPAFASHRLLTAFPIEIVRLFLHPRLSAAKSLTWVFRPSGEPGRARRVRAALHARVCTTAASPPAGRGTAGPWALATDTGSSRKFLEMGL